MEILRGLIYLSSIVFGLALPFCGLGLTLFLLGVRRLRMIGVTAGPIVLGAISVVHMAMVLLQNGTVPPAIRFRKEVVQGLSFDDLALGRSAPLEVFIGAVGLVSAVAMGIGVARRLTSLLAQLENVPTSTVRSAAIGLAEFKGIVRQAAPALPAEQDWELDRMPQENVIEGNDIKVPEDYVLVDETRQVKYRQGNTTVSRPMQLWKWSAFSLDDGTGRILIDPRRVAFDPPGLAAFFLGAVQFLSLTKNWEATKRGHRRFLKPGDRVSVLGAVQMNELAAPDAVDSERLVVRPRNISSSDDRRPVTESPFFSGKLEDVFILTDDPGKGLASSLRDGRALVYKVALAVMIASVLHLGRYLPKLSG